MSDLAKQERAQLSDAFDRFGPDSPTLSGDWTTRDLAAHLVLRERRPDAAGGILLPLLANRTESVQQQIAAQPWPQLVEQFRSGPPAWSPMRVGAVDEVANLAEFYVHHEDVLRGADPSARRARSEQLENALWGVLGRMGRFLLRKSPVGVDVRAEGHRERPLTKAGQGDGRVTLVGAPGEVVLRVFGRGIADPAVTDVVIEGDDAAVAKFAGFNPSF